jgi:aryl-alcohol dehydrogenase-like predicted oxidoreductase
MNYRGFGNTGIRVSDLILGTWYLPNSGTKVKPQVDRESSLKLIRKAYDLGINFFDTADVYRGVYDRDNLQGNYQTVGLSEKILGEALKGYDRESFVVATKVMGRTGALQNDLGLNRKHVRSAIAKSLERLQMDYVDFYLMHAPDGVTGRYESARTMNILIDDGKILHYGLSNFESHEIAEYLSLHGIERPSFIQDKFNLIERDQERRNIAVAEKNGMASMIYSPLAQGVLAGRYLGSKKDKSRSIYEKNFSDNKINEGNREKLLKLREISKGIDATMSHVALAWIIGKGKAIFPIIGSTNTQQLEENVNASDLRLSADIIKELDTTFSK